MSRVESVAIFAALAKAARHNGDYKSYMNYRDCAARLRGTTALVKSQRFVRAENQNVRDANELRLFHERMLDA